MGNDWTDVGLPDREIFGAALSSQLLWSKPAAAVEFLDQRTLQRSNRGIRITMGAAERLLDNSVDHSQRLEIGRSDLHRFSGFSRLVRRSPKDRGATLGRDDRIDGVLEHQHAIGSSNRDRTAGTTFADHCCD
jgi:hypothetical protein